MRKLFDFHGGIHPPENKLQSLGGPIADAGIPPQLVLPLSQHIGAPAVPVVAVGDQVRKGQPIAEPRGRVSVPVHASTSGRIAAIEERLVAHPSGRLAPCIVIESDGRDEWAPHAGTDDYRALDREELLQLIRDAGIAGMGGAGFPAAVKLSPPPGARIRTLIINGTECEPYITADDVLMRERADRILSGTAILQHLLEPAETLVGIEDNKPEAIAAMRRAAEGTGIEVVVFPTKYPSGGERQLIEILTGKQVPSGGLPADVGIVCQNVGSAAAVHDAVVLGRPLISRVTTVTGRAVRHPQNFEVRLGTPMSYLLDRAGYDSVRCRRLIMGGPMMGFTVPDPQVPVVKTTNCLLATTADELPPPAPPQACIRCGLCAQACPASLLPQQLFWFAQGREWDKLESHHVFDCIECGACSWVCPSNIPLVQYYRAAKAEILQRRRDQEQAEQSRLRFEARQARIAREAAEKEARRAARKAAAELRAQEAGSGEGEAAVDPVQAAIERARAKKAAQTAGTGIGTVDEREKLEKAVTSAHKRLETAAAKLAEARAQGSERVTALQTGLDKTQAKLAAAEAALEAYALANPTAAGDAPAPDPAQAAIDRARAARASAGALDPLEQAQARLRGLEERLEKTTTRLEACRAQGDEAKIIEALAATQARLRDKLGAARAELQQLEVG